MEQGEKDMIERGDIYYADLRPVPGAGEGGLCPLFIVQPDVGEGNAPTVIAAEITFQIPQTLLSTQVKIAASESGLSNDFVISLEKIRAVDKRRLTEKIGRLNQQTMQDINAAILGTFGLGGAE